MGSIISFEERGKRYEIRQGERDERNGNRDGEPLTDNVIDFSELNDEEIDFSDLTYEEIEQIAEVSEAAEVFFKKFHKMMETTE